jgi:hypothetical protein
MKLRGNADSGVDLDNPGWWNVLQYYLHLRQSDRKTFDRMYKTLGGHEWDKVCYQALKNRVKPNRYYIRADMVLDSDYWDCECENDFIHDSTTDKCSICNVDREDQPLSRLGEVIIAAQDVDKEGPGHPYYPYEIFFGEI